MSDDNEGPTDWVRRGIALTPEQDSELQDYLGYGSMSRFVRDVIDAALYVREKAESEGESIQPHQLPDAIRAAADSHYETRTEK